ncbi:hypothetical protein FRC11_009197 [Ceratobasidium sp. 423]|nr:hypothetical protein FRC11_009197 [Ceratobasidium sp. 423]
MPADPYFPEALRHESTPEHVLARRRIDRAPPPVPLSIIVGIGDDEGLQYMPNLALGSSHPGPSSSIHPHVEPPSGSLPQPMEPGAAPAKGVAGSESDAQGFEWHTTVCDLFGATAEDWDDPNDEDEQIALPEVLESLGNMNVEELPSPPASPSIEEINFNPWTHTEHDAHEPDHTIEVPENAEVWWPFTGRQTLPTVSAIFLCRTLQPPPPWYIQAHIAQLRLITHKRITSIRAAEQAAAQVPNASSAHGNTTRRPRIDTGFWIAVNTRFDQLVAFHGANYIDNEG